MVTKRTTAGANAWKKVEGVMGDKFIPRKLIGKVFSSCVTQVYMKALETMALKQKQQEKVQVCEKQPGKNNRRS